MFAHAGWPGLRGREWSAARTVLRGLEAVLDWRAAQGYVSYWQIADAMAVSTKTVQRGFQLLECTGLVEHRPGVIRDGRTRPGWVRVNKRTLARWIVEGRPARFERWLMAQMRQARHLGMPLLEFIKNNVDVLPVGVHVDFKASYIHYMDINSVERATGTRSTTERKETGMGEIPSWAHYDPGYGIRYDIPGKKTKARKESKSESPSYYQRYIPDIVTRSESNDDDELDKAHDPVEDGSVDEVFEAVKADGFTGAAMAREVMRRKRLLHAA